MRLRKSQACKKYPLPLPPACTTRVSHPLSLFLESDGINVERRGGEEITSSPYTAMYSCDSVIFIFFLPCYSRNFAFSLLRAANKNRGETSPRILSPFNAPTARMYIFHRRAINPHIFASVEDLFSFLRRGDQEEVIALLFDHCFTASTFIPLVRALQRPVCLFYPTYRRGSLPVCMLSVVSRSPESVRTFFVQLETLFSSIPESQEPRHIKMWLFSRKFLGIPRRKDHILPGRVSPSRSRLISRFVRAVSLKTSYSCSMQYALILHCAARVSRLYTRPFIFNNASYYGAHRGNATLSARQTIMLNEYSSRNVFPRIQWSDTRGIS